MVYVMADGGEDPFLPPFDESLKQGDTNKDQRLHREEMKSNKDAYATLDGWTRIATTTWTVRSTTSSAIQLHPATDSPQFVYQVAATLLRRTLCEASKSLIRAYLPL